MNSRGRREWENFASGFEQLSAPLRPSVQDVEAMRAAVTGHDRKVLLLGVTPELAMLGTHLIAADKEARMLAEVWPGDNECRKAVLANWLDLPFPDASFEAVIGDGSLNAVAHKVDALLPEIKRLLVPGGVAALRVFCAPEQPETIIDIQRDVGAGWRGNPHALAWRIAMAMAPSKPGAIVPLRELWQEINEAFPDRGALARQGGWSIAQINTLDRFETAEHSIVFPTLGAMLKQAERLFPFARIIPAAGYPLAEHCPTIVWSNQPLEAHE